MDAFQKLYIAQRLNRFTATRVPSGGYLDLSLSDNLATIDSMMRAGKFIDSATEGGDPTLRKVLSPARVGAQRALLLHARDSIGCQTVRQMHEALSRGALPRELVVKVVKYGAIGNPEMAEAVAMGYPDLAEDARKPPRL